MNRKRVHGDPEPDLLTLDEASHRATCRGRTTVLAPLSFRMLRALAKAAPHAVSRESLRAQVWGDVHVSPDAVKQRVRLLRRALVENGLGADFVRTVTGEGYAFSGKVRILASATASREASLTRRWRAMLAVASGGIRWQQPWYARIVTALAALVVLTPIVWIALTPSARTEKPRPLRVVVLPLEGDVVEPRRRSLPTTLEAELNVFLGRHRHLATLSPSSAAVLAGIRARDIGRKVDAQAVIEWSIRRSVPVDKLFVQLIDARTETALWSCEYSLPHLAKPGEWSSIMAHIGRMVVLELESLRVPGSVAGGTSSIAAFGAYLEGVDVLKKPLGDADLRRALDHFEIAVTLDPDFSLAHARLAETQAKRALRLASPQLAESSRKHAEKALTMTPRLAEAEFALGLSSLVAGDRESAMAQIARARRDLPYVHFDLQLLQRSRRPTSALSSS